MSPEAPVPIVEVEKRENRLGGAANVGLNLKALGAKPILCSVIGDDPKGNEFIELLKGEGMLLDGIIQSSSRITTTKFRVIGNNSQLLRVDEETTENLEEIYQEAIQNKVKEIIQVNDVDVIIFQDYDKGVINAELIEFVSKEAKEFDIPVVIDPKKENFMHYKDVTLFKPNLKEIKDGLNTDFDENNDADIEINVAKLQDELNADMVLNTLSEKGVFISWRIDGGYESMLIPAHVRNIADVSGAGDTVISVAALCVSQKLEPPIMAAISNLAGGLVCEEVGVVSLDKGKLLNEINNILIKT
jgi:rfaE bifunctional protein kinase chain/domain